MWKREDLDGDAAALGKRGFEPLPPHFELPPPLVDRLRSDTAAREAMGDKARAMGEVHHSGALADLLLVDGDPLADIAILQNRNALAMIMKDGALHKAPSASPSAAGA